MESVWKNFIKEVAAYKRIKNLKMFVSFEEDFATSECCTDEDITLLKRSDIIFCKHNEYVVCEIPKNDILNIAYSKIKNNLYELIVKEVNGIFTKFILEVA